jgi:exopolyphosphatase/guanosine-5'-triphosphate,3'-diphosphate pyrophosphatase
VNWRAHPDYRSVQGLNLVANANFSGIDHAGRAFLALATAYRHLGPFEDPDFQIRTLASPRALDRARILGAAMRVAYLISVAQPGVLPRTPMLCAKTKVRLELPPALADLGSERIFNRVRQLARLIGREAELAA